MKRGILAGFLGCLMLVVAPASATAATHWAVVTTPNPTGSTKSVLHSVSCSSPTACTAVGWAGAGVGTGGSLVTLAERWNGTTWSIQATPNPSSAQYSFLFAVACSGRLSCLGVGSTFDTAGNNRPLSERWNGSRWSIRSVPTPTGGMDAELGGLSCAGGQCIAVGDYIVGSTGLTLAERWNGSTWSVLTTPDPTGSVDAHLYSVSCTTSTECVAVGLWSDSSGDQFPLAERWNGSAWSTDTIPVPSGSTGTQLVGVSCVSTVCTAVGNWSEGTTELPLAERYDGTSWAIQTTPAPAGSTSPSLNGVSCATTSSCVAVGGYINASNVPDALGERWNGIRWVVQNPIDPSGATTTTLPAITCTAASACTATGDYIDSGGDVLSLAERYS